MQYFALLMIVTVTTVEFLAQGDKWGRFAILPGSMAYLPEILGAVALVFVIALGMHNRFKFVRPAYWILFGLLGLTTAAGAVVNGVDSGPIFAGIRTYLRAIPWFFVPAIFAFSDKQVRAQLRWLLALCVIQVPIAIEQRIETANVYFGFTAVTGDWTTGTLLESGILTVFLVCAACVACALAIRKRLLKKQFLLIFVLLLVPVTINETKVTLLLLPIGVVTTFLFASRPGERAKQILVALGLFAVTVAVFVPIYNKLIEDRPYSTPIGAFFTDRDRAKGYLLSDQQGLGPNAEVRRGDALIVAVRQTTGDPVRAAFGVGIGNASESALGRDFSGRFNRLYEPFLIIGFTRVLLELGFLGFGLLLTVYWLIFQDARVVASRGEGNKAAFAAAWAGITIVMAIGLFYSKVEASSALSFLFWYFSGLVAAERMRLTVPDESREQEFAKPSHPGVRSTSAGHTAI